MNLKSEFVLNQDSDDVFMIKMNKMFCKDKTKSCV